MWISIILALLSYFTAKKSGASNTKAAVIAGAAGLGTYYVASETEWGRSTLGSLNDGIAGVAGFGAIDAAGKTVPQEDVRVLRDGAGNPVLGPDGQPLYEKISAPVERSADGSIVKQEDGSVLGSLISGTTGVLKSWGGTGTAAVIGAGSIAASGGDLKKWLPWVIGGGVLLLIFK